MGASKESLPNYVSNIKGIWANLLTSVPPEIMRELMISGRLEVN